MCARRARRASRRRPGPRSRAGTGARNRSARRCPRPRPGRSTAGGREWRTPSVGPTSARPRRLPSCHVLEPVRFSTDDGVSLEGEIRRPQGEPRGSVVLCHALPRRGGSKDHPLLWAIRNALAGSGLTALAFNFRGVMRSGGTFGGGRSEVDDVRVTALALVGLPLGESGSELPALPPPSGLRTFRRPVLLLSGQGDTFSPRPELELLA